MEEKNKCPFCKCELHEIEGGESFDCSTIQAWTVATLYNQLMMMNKKLRENEEIDIALVEQCRLHGKVISEYGMY